MRIPETISPFWLAGCPWPLRPFFYTYFGLEVSIMYRLFATLFASLLLQAIFFLPHCLADTTWQSVGPYSGNIRIIVIDPNNRQTVYAGTWDNGIFKTTNGGASWSSANNGLKGTGVRALAIDPTNSQTVYAGTGNGVFKSTDGGASWTEVDAGMTSKYVESLAIDPKNSHRIYAGTQGGGLFKSNDGAASWTTAGSGITETADTEFFTIVVDPTNSQTVYAGTTDALFKSTNSGVSWAETDSGIDKSNMPNMQVTAIAIDPTNSQAVYAATVTGIFKSANAGASWTRASSGQTELATCLVIDPDNSQTVYAGTGLYGLFKSTDAGATWIAANIGLTNMYLTCLAIDPADSQTVYAGTFGDGVFKSTNGGALWRQASSGMNTVDVAAVAIDPAQSQTVYAGTYSSGIFKSTNAGATWRSVTSGMTVTNVNTIAIDPIDSQTVYFGTDYSGIFKSTDGGTSWVAAANSGITSSLVQVLAIDPNDSQTVYAGTDYGGVFKSTDGGVSWSGANIGMPNSSVHAIAIDPANGQTIYAGTWAGVFKSTNGGASWTVANSGISNSTIQALAIDPTNSKTVYAGTMAGIFISTDGGVSWANSTGNQIAVLSLALDPGNSRTVYAGTISGVIKSTDGGLSWTKENNLATNAQIHALAIDPTNSQTVYAGTYGAGIFKSVLSINSTVSAPAVVYLNINSAGSFNVSASGWPAPTLSVSGVLPSGLSFNPSSGIVSGMPLLGSAGSYTLLFSAGNGLPPDASTAVNIVILPFTTSNIAISAPASNSTATQVSSITGTASGSGLSSVSVQVTDGVYYLQADGSFGSAPPSPWLSASGTTNWLLGTSSVAWVPGISYTITAQTNTGKTATSFFTVPPPAAKQGTILAASFGSGSLKAGDSATLNGTLTKADASLLAAKTVKIIITPPATAAAPNPSPVIVSCVTDPNGNFSSGNLSSFAIPGIYTVQVRFEGDAAYQASVQSFSLPVVAQSGYAIIVVGKASDNSLLGQHTASATGVYDTLITKRGFLDKNIITLISTASSAVTKQQIQAAISQIKAKYAAAPAPFYLFMIDHGSPTGFMLGDSTPALTLTPAELAPWLDDFENFSDSATLATLASNNRFLIVGTCYSGLFQSLSKPGRVIVTSSAADEQSLAGASAYNSTSTVLSGGDYFIDSFVSFLGRGDSFNDAYDQAASAVALRDPRSGTVPLAFHSGAIDTLAQHPLLDDDGDGTPSYGPGGGGDGALAASLYLGEGVRVPAAGNPSDISAVTPSALAPISILSSTASTTTLWLSVNDNSRVGKAWVEVRTPDTTAVAGGTGQVIPSNLDSMPLVYDGLKWVGDYGIFTKAGRYDIYYYTSDNQTGDISPMAHSVVYKQLAGSASPASFALSSPNDGDSVATEFPLNWQESADPQGLTYTLLVSTDSNFGTIVYRQDDLPQAATYLQQGALKDPASATGGYYCQNRSSYCYWKVQAIDSYGAITESPSRKFTIVETNGLLGMIKGYLRNSGGAPLAKATVTVGNSNITTLVNGFYLAQVPSGSYSVTAAANGYSKQAQSVVVRAANVSSADFMLSVPASAPASQSISFTTPASASYGNAPLTLTASATSALPVSFTLVSGPAQLNGATLAITGAGTVTVKASQAGNGSYAAASDVQQSIAVSRATLTVSADNQSRSYNSANPTLTASFTGFVGADTKAVLSGAPAISTGAILTSLAGNYPITITQGTLAAANYSFALVNGTLSVTGASKPGDCDGNGTVSIAEVQSAINMFLGLKPVQLCVDLDNSGVVTISEVQKVINAFLGL
jgi:photosystem II stability/assembly factor-like uncharacterized protein